MPMAVADMPKRSPLKLVMMILKPLFSSPNKLPTGTRTLSKCRLAVSEQCQPILCSLVRVMPNESPGTAIIEIPPAPLLSASVRTARLIQSKRMPDVMKVFSPLMM